MYYLRKPDVFCFKVFGCKCFVLNTKDSLGKFDAKSYEVIFVGYSNTSKAYRVFNRSTLTVEESTHFKLEESNSHVMNIVEIDSLGKDFEKIFMKVSPAPKENDKKNNTNGEAQDVEVEPTQPLLKDWRFTTNHPKDLIIGDVSKGVTTHSKLHDICFHFTFITHIEPKNILKADGDSY